MNLDYALAIKIGSYYDEIKKSERNVLIKLFNQLTDIEIRVDNTLGKLSIILLTLLMVEKKDNIVVSNIGFSVSSFEFLIENMKKILQNLEGLNNKILLFWIVILIIMKILNIWINILINNCKNSYKMLNLKKGFNITQIIFKTSIIHLFLTNIKQFLKK